MLPPLLLLIGACVLIIPVIIMHTKMDFRQIWRKGVLFISLGHFLISSLILTVIPPDQFAKGYFAHPIFLGPFFISALPLVVFVSTTFIAHLGRLCFLLYMLNSVLWSIFVVGICYLVKRRRERINDEQRDKIEAAIQKITEDGIVKGPKGSYSSHKKWSVGTPHDTEPPEAKAYNGGPWP